LPQYSTPETSSPGQYQADPGHSLFTESTPARKGGRPRSPVGQQILALLADHPEGLSPAQVRRELGVDKPLASTMIAMARDGLLQRLGHGRYVIACSTRARQRRAIACSAPGAHQPGKRNTQQIERKHLTLRTRIKRLVRKTICFSRSIQMHGIVLGLCIHRYEFGLRV
jgi:hypothetical protein